jgi:hypothetical protein
MRHSHAIHGSPFHDLARDVLRLLIDDADEEPSLDTFRGFRDPNEHRRRGRPEGWRSREQEVRPI